MNVDSNELAASVGAADAILKKGDLSADNIVELHKGVMSGVPETKPAPDTEAYTAHDAMVIAMFNSLGKRQQANILRDVLQKPKDDPVKAFTIREANNKIQQAQDMFNLKKIVAMASFVVLLVAIVIICGVFAYEILKKGSLGDNGVINGIFSTFLNVLKIIWNAPTGT